VKIFEKITMLSSREHLACQRTGRYCPPDAKFRESTELVYENHGVMDAIDKILDIPRPCPYNMVNPISKKFH
jgi:hypothetical protein